MTDVNASKLRSLVDRLNCVYEGDINTDDYFKMATELESTWWEYRKAIGDMCDNVPSFQAIDFIATSAKRGAIDLLKKYLITLEPIVSGLSPNDQQPAVNSFVPMMRTMVSAVDDCGPLCTETQEKQIALPLQRLLDTASFLSARDVEDLEQGFGLHALNVFIFFANAMYRSPDIADLMNENNGPAILSKYSQSKSKILALRALIAQSYLVADPKGNELPINEDMLKFIWETVDRKMKRVSSGVGDFTLYGLLVYLHQLIRCSDACGKGLLKYGFLDSMATIMQAPAGSTSTTSTPGEKRTCAKICWALALLESCGVANSKLMKAHPTLSQALESIKPIRDDLAKAAEGALWQIKTKSERPGTARSRPGTAQARPPSAKPAEQVASRPGTAKAQEVARPGTAQRPPSAKPTAGPTPPEGVKPMVMVSYTSHWKPALVKRLSDDLTKNGVQTWIYNNEMKGDMYDEMAEAIESCAAVLICYCNPYFNSDPCHAELNYAREQKKLLVPVRLEKFTPRGWLGISISGKLYYDFATADTDEEAYRTQLSKLTEKLKSEFTKMGLC